VSDHCEPLPLANLQQRMIETIYGSEPDFALLGSIRTRRNLAPESLLAIYRNATQSTLMQVLRLSYPVVERLVGARFFEAVAFTYLRMTPSRGGDLEQYGASFGDFLDQHDPVAELPYLGDVARLEWLVSRLQRALVVKPLDRDQLAMIPPDKLGELQLSLIPRASLFESRYPVSRIWQENRDRACEPEPVSLEEGSDRCLIVVGDDIVVRTLTADEWEFFACFARGSSLITAAEVALALDNNFKVAAMLAYVLQSASSYIA
jgi:hypothetical protein